MKTREEIYAIYDLGREAVADLVQDLYRLIEQQQAQIASLMARVKELENQLATDSHNSSKPPSSDGFGKKTQSLRQPSGKKSGGQTGHKGTTLKQVAEPDRIVTHAPEQCEGCQADLKEVPGMLSEDRRQVFELPPLKLEVTQHQLITKACPVCGRQNTGRFPDDILPGAQYGSSVKSLAVYLNTQQLLPWRRTCQLLEELGGQPVAQGTLYGAVQECAAELAGIELVIKETIASAEVVHFDETGMYVSGKREWLHVASTPRLTAYAHDPKRGATATKAIGILPGFKGRAIHDGFGSYWTYKCEHGLCNAHHLRELTFIHERLGQEWARKMKDLLVEIKSEVDTAKLRGDTTLGELPQEAYSKRYQAILAEGVALEQTTPPLQTGKRGRKKQSKSKNLLDRMAKYQAETLAFMRDFNVSFDNNLAERDIRMMKVQQKISGGFRTTQGAKTFCRIRSYISTMSKQGHNILTALKSVFAGNPISPSPG